MMHYYTWSITGSITRRVYLARENDEQGLRYSADYMSKLETWLPDVIFIFEAMGRGLSEWQRERGEGERGRNRQELSSVPPVWKYERTARDVTLCTVILKGTRNRSIRLRVSSKKKCIFIESNRTAILASWACETRSVSAKKSTGDGNFCALFFSYAIG